MSYSVHKLVSSCVRLVFDAEQAADNRCVEFFICDQQLPPLFGSHSFCPRMLTFSMDLKCVCVCNMTKLLQKERNVSAHKFATFVKFCPIECVNTWMPVRLPVRPQRICAWHACCVQKQRWRAQWDWTESVTLQAGKKPKQRAEGC